VNARRLGTLFALGFASGLPYLLTHSTLSARLASQGIALETIGLLTLVSLPYSLKPLWAPLVDRFAPPFLGRRRGWMLPFQLATAAAIAWLGVTSANRVDGLALAAVAVAFFSASQDIVSDAYRTDLLAPAERPVGTSTYVLGYRVAMLIAGGFALVLADHLSWRRVYLVLAALMLAGVVATLLAPEPEAPAPPPSLRAAVVEPWLAFFRRWDRVGALRILAFVIAFRMGDLVLNDMVMPFLIAIGFGKSEIGVTYKIAGIAATIIGTLGGAALVLRIGLFRALGWFTLAQGISSLGYAALALAGRSHALLAVAVSIEQLCAGACIAALDMLLMALCDRRYSATQFALLVAASSLGGRILGAGSGFVARALGWPLFFTATALLALPVLLLLAALPSEVRAQPK
jgi:PAT family beta-lactamase induction signal transducer AmpG